MNLLASFRQFACPFVVLSVRQNLENCSLAFSLFCTTVESHKVRKVTDLNVLVKSSDKSGGPK